MDPTSLVYGRRHEVEGIERIRSYISYNYLVRTHGHERRVPRHDAYRGPHSAVSEVLLN